MRAPQESINARWITELNHAADQLDALSRDLYADGAPPTRWDLFEQLLTVHSLLRRSAALVEYLDEDIRYYRSLAYPACTPADGRRPHRPAPPPQRPPPTATPTR